MPVPANPEAVAVQVAAARQRFGARLRTLRTAAGLTQEQLAERLGVDRKSISRLENGRTSPALDVVFETAVGLDVPPIELFRW